MFTVIEIMDSEKGFIERIFSRLMYKPPELIKVAVKSGAPYFIIRISDSKKIPWEDVLYMAGRCASNVLVGENVEIPKGTKIRRFYPYILPLTILSNTVCDIFKSLDVKRIKLGINDPKAVLSEKLYDYIDFSSEITVVTEKEEIYRTKREQLLESNGISIILSENFESLKGCDAVISERAVDDVFCFSIEGNGSDNALEFSKFKLPPVYEQKIPKDIPTEIFAGALYELCGVRKIGELKYLSVNKGGITYSVEDFKKLLNKNFCI